MFRRRRLRDLEARIEALEQRLDQRAWELPPANWIDLPDLPDLPGLHDRRHPPRRHRCVEPDRVPVMAKPCPTCTAIFTGSHARCPTCRGALRKASRQRNGRTDSVYSTPAWRRQRAAKLARNPQCECGCGRPSEVVDHDPPRKQLIAAGVHDPDHERWLVALSKHCHDSKTATRDGGFGRPPQPRGLRPL